MDRFEAKALNVSLDELCNLHSSMDRYEAFNAVPTLLILAIYIPVWIDLKNRF